MIAVVVAFLTAVLDPTTGQLAAGAARTAPAYLTPDTALEHATAAATAARVYHVDPALLLSIAWHESRYSVAAVGPEVHGVSCGVMTPEPVARCPRATLLGGYMAGAAHLRTWLDATHDLHTALTGYAGGYALIAACARGEKLHGCDTPAVFLGRARAIRVRGAS